MDTSRERQKRFYQRQRDAGMVKLSVWVHAAQSADAYDKLRTLGSDSDYELGAVRNTRTGKFLRKEEYVR